MSDAPYDPSAGEKQEASDAGVGGAVFRENESATTAPAESGTVMAMHTTSTRAQIDGIVEQSRADVGDGNAEELARVIRQRLGEARIDLDDATVAELADS